MFAKADREETKYLDDGESLLILGAHGILDIGLDAEKQLWCSRGS
jgi:hypothetical protein